VTRDVLGAKAAIWDAQEDAQKEAYLAMELWLPEKRRAFLQARLQKQAELNKKYEARYKRYMRSHGD